MIEIITPYSVVTEREEAKRFVAMHLDAVAREEDVNAETAQMGEAGTNTVLITEEQNTRLIF